MEMEEQRTRYLVTYTADSADPFLALRCEGMSAFVPS